MATGVFNDVKSAPPIEVFATMAAFHQDPHPDKIDLSVGGMYFCILSKLNIIYMPDFQP